MATINEQLMEIFQEHIQVENETLIALQEAESSAREAAVRLVFMEMRLDTMKHKEFLHGLVDMMTTTPCDRWSAKVQRYIDRVILIRQLESFRKQETKMIELLEMALKEMDDSLGILLLQHLRADEEKHHTNLEELTRLIQMQPLQTVKGATGSSIVCDTEDE